MSDRIEEAFAEYKLNKMIDPATRYTSNEKDIFRAGWSASQKRVAPVAKESVWVNAPVAPDEDPE